MRTSHVAIIASVLFFLVGLGLADYVLVERVRVGRRVRERALPRESALQVAPTNVDLLTITRKAGFDFLPVSGAEQSFLRSLLPAERKHILRSIVLLRGGERASAVYWYRAPDTASHLQTVKAWMYELFSQKVTDLIDERIAREGFASIDILAFTDPALSEERFLFARIRDHLYEFHFPGNHEEWVQGILQELARE